MTLQPWGVSPGSEWVCTRCGARKGRGPESLANGKRVIRWWYLGADEQEADRLPACTGGRSYGTEVQEEAADLREAAKADTDLL